MRNGGSAVCLLVLVTATAGCTAQAAETHAADGLAVPAYQPPAGAPRFCTELAGSTHLATLPRAVGTLTAKSDDVDARHDVSLAIADLEPVLTEVRARPGYPALETALADLVAALHKATEAPLDDGITQAISSGLDAVGEQAQPVCRFPA